VRVELCQIVFTARFAICCWSKSGKIWMAFAMDKLSQVAGFSRWRGKFSWLLLAQSCATCAL
jgi:hypothetical protein